MSVYEIDCGTGEEVLRPATAEETAALEASRAETTTPAMDPVVAAIAAGVVAAVPQASLEAVQQAAQAALDPPDPGA